KWTKNPTYKVTYNGNGYTSGNVPTDIGEYEENASVTVRGNTGDLVKSGYTFAGWNTLADGTGTDYAATFTMGITNVTLYAKWSVSGSGSSGSSGSGVPSNSNLNGRLTLPAGASGELSFENAVKIFIPSGATDKEVRIAIEGILETENLLTNEQHPVSKVFGISKDIPENFKKMVTISFAFEMSKLAEGQHPAVFYYDEKKKEWVEVAGGKVAGNWISVEVNEFAKFTVLAVEKANAPVEPKDEFGDISNHWAATNIKQAVLNGFVSGYPNGMFKPDANVTRAEFVVMLMNALKLQVERAEMTYTDTALIGAWAQESVAQAVQAGIISGFGDGSFRPNEEVTRSEMVVMIARALNLRLKENEVTDFEDDHQIPTWAKGAVAAIKNLDLIKGKGMNEFAPNDKTTRAEAVTLLLRMLEQKSK
ncbi:S-layer homology domain-containing protein, partial [Paenibacillus sp. 2TAB26]|uniref:S-layer homology domain-containing protein n=1 Tax=Paenibacillus sp. 2TAB26 TaxID=3233005 RepID=UPI003F952685